MEHTREDLIWEFVRESNRIEWELSRKVSPDAKALQEFLDRPLTEKSLLQYHKDIAGDVDRAGQYRKVQVYIGDDTPPAPEFIPLYMESYWKNINDLRSRHAHNRFEKIHPFQDFNGRTGRAIRLHKALKEGYNFEIGFLHKYYYQALDSISDYM